MPSGSAPLAILSERERKESSVTTFQIGSRRIGDGQPTYIIAEAGINHQGDPQIARRLIEVAAGCGADAVKFQKRTVRRILTAEGLEAPYENRNSFGATYGAHKAALEFDRDTYAALKSHAESLGLQFLASAWDEESVDLLETLDLPAHKVASADLTNLPLLQHMGRTGRPILLSTGMSTLDEVDRAVETLRRYHDQIVLLQCTSTYPSRFDQINLRVMERYRERYGLLVGYSGHEKGIAIPIAAVALGACVIERHFTLDRTMKGGDHAASLEPGGLQKMVRDIRHLEEALGDGQKQIYDEERPIRRKLAKSVVSLRPLDAGVPITREMLTTKGPGRGISAADLEQVVGRRPRRDIPADVVLTEDDLI